MKLMEILEPVDVRQSPKPALLPLRFERYVLLKQLAKGGMGELFLASAGSIEGAERLCVIKRIRAEHGSDPSFTARFMDEARILAQLQHPGVAQILEATTDCNGKPYAVIEYVEGRNLADVQACSTLLPLSWPEALAIGIALADALAYVHELSGADGQPLNIVHRDLSPQNVMISYAGDVKLIDFGTARSENRRCQTVSGVVFAKPGYVAPEVANNQPGGVPADLYAFGIMLWELLAGRRFLSGNVSAHLARVGAGEARPSPVAERSGAPLDLDTIIARLTAANVADRYLRMRDALQDLARILQCAPSMPDGHRGVRPRVGQLMRRLYPSEPAESRAKNARFWEATRSGNNTPPTTTAAPLVAIPNPIEKELLPGTRYHIGCEIGRGSTGVVYRAEHLDLGRTVALKVCKPDALNCEPLRREAQVMSRLTHENLVHLYEYGVSSDGRSYCAMELLEGQSLSQLQKRERRMDWKHAVQLGIQICDALEVAHEQGVVHCDLKPSNLFLTREGSIKVLDFGVAATAEHFANPTRSAPLEAWSLVGTPEYMAPEQAIGQATPSSDLYALAVVLYELITGFLPHQASNPARLLELKHTIPEPPSEFARCLPPELDPLLLKALTVSPKGRYTSAAEFRDALTSVLRIPEQLKRRRRRLVRTVGVALGLSMLALLAVEVQTPAGQTWVQQRILPFKPLTQKIRHWGLQARNRLVESPQPVTNSSAIFYTRQGVGSESVPE